MSNTVSYDRMIFARNLTRLMEENQEKQPLSCPKHPTTA